MSIIDRLHTPKPALVWNLNWALRIASQRRFIVILTALLLCVALAAISAVGHPFVATWFGLVLMGWAFMAGAARASRGL
jgi:hypothetical protein